MFVKLTEEERLDVERRIARDHRNLEVAERRATIDVLAARAGEPLDLTKIGGRTQLEYSKVTGADGTIKYLRVTCTNHQGAMVAMRDVPILDGNEATARDRLDRKAARDLGALIYANDD